MSTRCITPFYVKKSRIDQTKIPVACGKCPNCSARRTSGWSFRLLKQEEISYSALFVTLTYNTNHVPLTAKTFKTLRKSDLQKFFKRLRKISEHKLKYFAVGEYGGKTMRPHYHIILYNANPLDIEKAWSLDNKPIGTIFIGSVSGASIGYTLKYISKPGKVPKHKNDDRQKEFSVMSKGLGKNYLTENMIAWHKDILNERMYVNLKDNRKIAMPRYYKDKLYNESEKSRIGRYIADKIEQEESELITEHGENLYSYLAELHLSQFRKMHKKSKQDEKL